MTDTILVLNAGSSSIKFSVHDGSRPTATILDGQIEGIGVAPRLVATSKALETSAEHRFASSEVPDHDAAIAKILVWLAEHSGGIRPVAAGHRVVHGGERFSGPVRIDATVLAEIERLVPLAPLHQPHHVAAIRALDRIAPDLPQIACFDTAFHRTQDVLARSFALPRALTERGIRRYGFHGISYEYIASMLDGLAPTLARGRTVVAHLGNGASLCAMREGTSVATSMGMTALDGLVMGTRPGNLDPGVILHLMQREGMDAERIEQLLYHESGLLGVSGVSSDMRRLLASHEPTAREAIDLFVHRIVREVGSMAAALGGIDGLVFTAGIGENAPAIRAGVLGGCRWLGFEIDEAANLRGGPELTRPGSKALSFVVATDENSMIARHVRELLRIGSNSTPDE